MLTRVIVLVCLMMTLSRCNINDDAIDVNDANGDISSSRRTTHDLFSTEDSEFYSDQNYILRDAIDMDEAEAAKIWDKLEKKLDKELEKIRTRGNKLIPETSLEKILNNGGKIPEKVAEKVRKRGVLIIRNTIPKEETNEMMADLMKYLYTNNGFPKDQNETVYEIYWSKPQMRARQHTNMYTVQKALLRLWTKDKDNEMDVDLEKPVMYIDRLRIQPPGDALFRIQPHVDGGGLERWSNPNYRQVYRQIYENFDNYDPFDVNFRN